jgi:hypothetical protein
MRYGTIIYEVRDELGINNTEMLLLDTVAKLQSASVEHPGWCGAGGAYLTWVLGVDRTTFFRIQKRLEERGLIECLGNGLRRVPQSIVYQLFVKDDAQSSGKTPLPTTNSGKTPLGVVAKRHSTSGKTPPNNTDNTIDITAAAAKQKNQVPSEKKAKRTQAPPNSARPPRAPRPISFSDSGWLTRGVESFRLELCSRFDIGDADVDYYFGRCKKWSAGASSGKSADWIETAYNFITDDFNNGKLKQNSTKTASHGKSKKSGASLTAQQLAEQTQRVLEELDRA